MDDHEEGVPGTLRPQAIEDVEITDAVVRSGTRRWRQQYDRMKRARHQTRDVAEVNIELEDGFYAFFVWCFHLKDWLKNDDTVPADARATVEAFVESKNDSLAVAGDLANGVKHLRRYEGAALVDPDMHLSMVQGAFQDDAFQTGAFEAEDHIVVVVEGGYRNAFEVADACIAAWDDFLRAHGLL